MSRPPLFPVTMAAACALLAQANAHESFLLWHDHRHAHAAAEEHSVHAGHAHHDHKEHHKEEIHVHEEHADARWSIGTGVRYTRLSLHGERADLWETGLGVAYRALPWLELGAEASYGWFDSREGDTGGWMVPHFHVDAHLPVAENLEFVVGGEVGFPGGDEGLVGDHWEFIPHIALRYDTGKWFAEAGASYVFITGGDDHGHHEEDSHEEHGDEDEHHEEHAEEEGHEEHGEHEEEHVSHDDGHSTGDFHEVVDPHGKRELQYHVAAGVRLLDERLTLEGRISGVHVTEGETPDRDYLRAGVRTTWAVSESWRVRAEASVPITDARRNHFQGSLSVQVSF